MFKHTESRLGDTSFFSGTLGLAGQGDRKSQGYSSTMQLPMTKRVLSGIGILFFVPIVSTHLINVFSSSEWEDQRASLSCKLESSSNLDTRLSFQGSLSFTMFGLRSDFNKNDIAVPIIVLWAYISLIELFRVQWLAKVSR